jgi:Leu/Phe-tRNA-protein transferase
MATIVNPQATKAAIEAILIASLEAVVNDLAQAFQNLISSTIYDWPNTTERKNGTTVSSPRNIVDLGNFKNSQRLQRINRALFQYVWDIQYAVYIYYGYRTLSGSQMPGRDWISPALEDIFKKFEREVKSRV